MNDLMKKNLIILKLFSKQAALKITVSDACSSDNILDKLASKIVKAPAVIIVDFCRMYDKEALILLEKIKYLTQEFDSSLFVLNRADYCFLCGADGIILSENAITPHQARDIVGEHVLIGIESYEKFIDSHFDFCISDGILSCDDYEIKITDLVQ